MTKTLPMRLHTSCGALFAMVSVAAHAHHPMDGAMPESFAQGLLSGMGHPVIEPGHLLFLLGAAFLVAACDPSSRRGLGSLALLVLASLGAAFIGAIAGVPPGVELAVGATLVLLAAALWLLRVPRALAGSMLSILAGAVHGLAYAESVIGAEPGPLVAYLAGLAVVQGGMLAATWLLVRRCRPAVLVGHFGPSRWASASMAFAGLFVMFPIS